MEKKNQKKEQVGNFIIKEYGDKIRRIGVETVAGDWKISFQVGTAMFTFIDILLDKNRDVLHALIVTWYESSMIVPDGDLLLAHRKAYDEYYERVPMEEVGIEEDAEILEELKRVEEIHGEEDDGAAGEALEQAD